MTHRDIYIKFMIGYDKANVTSSYPSLTEYEIATFLDKAYLALIAQKVTGNNSRHIGFEQDLKLTEDLGPLVTTKRINTDINTSPIPYVSNALSCGKPNDWLYFVSGEMKRGLGDYEKTWDMQLITHDVASKFQTTAYNIPWIKHPVCYEEGNRIYVLYDSILQSANAGSNPSLSLTYIKKPKKFMVNDEPEIVIPGAPTVTSNYEDRQNVTLHIGDTFLIEYTNGSYGSVMVFSSRIIDTVTSETSTGGTINCTAQYVGEGALTLKSTAHPTWQYLINFTVVPNEGATEEWTKSITGPDTILGSGSVTARYLANMVSSLYGFYNCEWTITPMSGLDGHLLSDYILYGSNGNLLTINRLRNYTYDITVFIKAEPVGISDLSRKQAATVSKYVRITNEAYQPEQEQWYISFNPDTYNISQDNTIPLEAHMDSSLGDEDVPVFSITSGNNYARITNQHAGTYQQEATLEILSPAEGNFFPITITVRGTNHSEISENYYVYVQYTNNETPNPPTPTIWHFGDLLPAGLYGSGSEPQPSQPATLITAPTAKSLTYNGSAQLLINPGVASGGTLLYRMVRYGSSTAWSSEIPTLTNADIQYEIYYMIEGDSSHSDVTFPNSIYVEISQKQLGVTWSNTSFTYDGNTHVPTATPVGVVGSDSVSFEVTGGASSVGTYTATINGMSGSGYNNYLIPQNNTCQFTISNSGSSSEASVTTAPTAKSLTYNGQSQDLLNAGTASGGTLYYSLNGTDTTPTWSTSIPQLTNAGTYSVWHKVVGDSSHTDSPVYGPMLVTIEKKEVTLTWGNTTFVYDGSSHVPSVSASGVITGDSVSVSVSGDQTNVGTYTATASMTSQNYKLPSNYTCQFIIAAPQLQLSEFNSQSSTGYYVMKFDAYVVRTNNGFGINMSSANTYVNIIVYIDRENGVVKCPSNHYQGSWKLLSLNETTQSIESTVISTKGGGTGDEYCTEMCDIARIVMLDKYGISLTYDSSSWDNNVIVFNDSDPQITLSGYIDRTRQISLSSLSEFNNSSPSGYYILRGNVLDMEYRSEGSYNPSETEYLGVCLNCVVYIDRTNSLIKTVADRDVNYGYAYACDESTNIVDSTCYFGLSGWGTGKLYYIASAASEGLLRNYNLDYLWISQNKDTYIDVKGGAPVISGYIRGVQS